MHITAKITFIHTCLHDANFLLSVVRRLLWRRKSPFSSWDHSWLSHFFALVHPLCLECAKVMFFYFWRKFFFSKFYMAFVLKIENSFYPWREDHLLWSSSLGGTFTCSSSSFHLSERCKTFQIITGKFVKIWQLHYVMYILCLV